MSYLRRALVLVVACLASAASSLDAQVSFRHVLAFGDSLTDTDLRGRMSPRQQLRFGADPIDVVFSRVRRAGDRLDSYARAGARCGQVRAQLVEHASRYYKTGAPNVSLISYQAGVNDVFDHFDVFKDRTSAADADVIADSITRCIVEDLLQLVSAYPRARLVVWTIPDVPSMPFWGQLSPVEKRNVRRSVARINQWIRMLEWLHPHFLVLDVEVLFYHYVRNPRRVEDIWLLPLPRIQGALFGDLIHPSAVFNALIADHLIDRMNLRWGAGIRRFDDSELAALARLVDW